MIVTFTYVVSAPIPTPAPPPSDFAKPDIRVNCLANGIRVEVDLTEQPNFHGVLYVKGHANVPKCQRHVQQGEAAAPIDFDVSFGTCGLFHSDVSCVH